MKGYISNQIAGESYIDENGIPVSGTLTWGDDVECKYFATENNNKGRYIDGDFKQIAFVITTEDMSFRANIIRLKDSKGNVICNKEVQSLEELESVQRIKITV